jgi:hypothetical protein
MDGFLVLLRFDRSKGVVILKILPIIVFFPRSGGIAIGDAEFRLPIRLT